MRTRATEGANPSGDLTITAPLIVPPDRNVRAMTLKEVEAEGLRYVHAQPDVRRRMVLERWRTHRDLMARLDPSRRDDSLEDCERRTMAGDDLYR